MTDPLPNWPPEQPNAICRAALLAAAAERISDIGLDPQAVIAAAGGIEQDYGLFLRTYNDTQEEDAYSMNEAPDRTAQVEVLDALVLDSAGRVTPRLGLMVGQGFASLSPYQICLMLMDVLEHLQTAAQAGQFKVDNASPILTSAVGTALRSMRATVEVFEKHADDLGGERLAAVIHERQGGAAA